MLNIEKTLQSVRDLLDRLDKEGVEFALVESKYCNCVAGIQDPKDDVRVFLDCTIGTDGRFSWQDYDGHEGLCDFDEFRVLIINLTADKCLDKAKEKREQWADLCDNVDTPMPDSLAAVVSGWEGKADRLRALLEPDDPPLLDERDFEILRSLLPHRLVGPGKKSICVRTSRGPILLRSAVEPEEEAKRLRELGVLERRYIIDHPAHGQVFYDFLIDKGWKALDFAWYVGLV